MKLEDPPAVAIIGAGLSGVAVAHECVKQGLSFVMFEMDEKVSSCFMYAHRHLAAVTSP
jgi:cation diffusion facilitator CzcD-associated flavoprotein CzcO